jgi:hypothetical protein
MPVMCLHCTRRRGAPPIAASGATPAGASRATGSSDSANRRPSGPPPPPPPLPPPPPPAAGPRRWSYTRAHSSPPPTANSSGLSGLTWMQLRSMTWTGLRGLGFGVLGLFCMRSLATQPGGFEALGRHGAGGDAACRRAARPQRSTAGSEALGARRPQGAPRAHTAPGRAARGRAGRSAPHRDAAARPALAAADEEAPPAARVGQAQVKVHHLHGDGRGGRGQRWGVPLSERTPRQPQAGAAGDVEKRAPAMASVRHGPPRVAAAGRRGPDP